MKENYLKFPRLIILCLFFLLFPLATFAQSTWQWAKSGGSINNLGNNDEDVSDLLLDKENNIYMLSTIGKSMANVDGIPLTTSGAVYGNQSATNNVISSFNCSGDYRWSRVIGGSGGDEMQRIGIDDEGNIYGVGRFTRLNSTYEQFVPIHFRNDTGIDLILPSSITDGQHKESLFIVKYNSHGVFQWLRMPQAPDVTFASISHNRSLDLHVDPSGDLYWLCTIPPGTYANGAFVNTLQGDNLFVFKYDASGNFVGSFPIDIKAEGSAGGEFILKRNPATGILYIAGYIFTDGMVTIAGEPVTGGMYIAAFSSDGTYLWKKQSAMAGTSSIRDLVIDAEGALYFTGTTYGGDDQFEGNNIGTGDTTTAPYIIKLDANGNYLWSTTAITQAATRGFGITVNNAEVAVTGDMNGLQWQGLVSPLVMNVNYDVMFARFNKNDGSIISLQKIEGNPGYYDAGSVLAADYAGNYYMGGKVGNTLTIGNNLLLNGGEDFDFFVAKFGTANCETMSTEAKVKEQAVVYPNPFTDTFSVKTDVDVAYILYDVKGVKVQAGTILKENPSIESRWLTAGLYLLVLQDSAGNKKSIKLVKR